jgi:hypothetical protein
VGNGGASGCGEEVFAYQGFGVSARRRQGGRAGRCGRYTGAYWGIRADVRGAGFSDWSIGGGGSRVCMLAGVNVISGNSAWGYFRVFQGISGSYGPEEVKCKVMARSEKPPAEGMKG